MNQKPKRRFTKMWLILGLLVVVIGLPVCYFTFKRDIYADPRPEDVVELFRAMQYRGPPKPLHKVASWIGQQKRLWEFYHQLNEKRGDKADSAWQNLIESEYLIETIPYWVEALKDEDGFVRVEATFALGYIGPAAKDAVPALVEALKDEDGFVRYHATFALGHIGPDAVPALIEALKDEYWLVRSNAADALEDIGPAARDAVPTLIEALKDEDVRVRWTAYRALKEIDPEAAAKAGVE